MQVRKQVILLHNATSVALLITFVFITFVVKLKLSIIPVSQVQDIALKIMHAVVGFSCVGAYFLTKKLKKVNLYHMLKCTAAHILQTLHSDTSAMKLVITYVLIPFS